MADPKRYVSLRHMEEEDVPFLCELECVPDVMEQTPTHEPIPEEVYRKYIRRQKARGPYSDQVRYVIQMERGEVSIPVGVVDLANVDDNDMFGEIGIALHPSYRREGMASAALSVLEKLARRSSMHTLVARVVSDNTPAISLFLSAGFQQCGVIPKFRKTDDGWKDVCIFSKTLS